MADSGIRWIDTIFDWAVIALVECARLFGMTYEEINVWLFCIIWPAMTLSMAFAIWRLWREIKSLRRRVVGGA